MPRVNHGFFTREGGLSSGIYASLNAGLGSGDERSHVVANRSRICAHLGAAFLATPHQVHSPDVLVISQPWDASSRPVADAVVTLTAGLAIGVLTADCGPVLFADPKAGIVGAAHAGWKGATGGVLENTIAKMLDLGAKASQIIAALGPTISQANYEVGPEFIERLVGLDSANARFVVASRKPGHGFFDLPGYILRRLKNAGVSAHWTGQCTYGDALRFYSYRRTTHLREPDYGRQVSCIMITE